MSSARPHQDGSTAAPGAVRLPDGVGVPTRGVVQALAVGCSLQGLTLAWVALGPGTSLNAFLFVHRGWTESAARAADALLAVGAVGGMLTLFRWGRSIGAVAVAAACLIVAIADTLVAGRAFSDWNVLATATRWGAPLALLSIGASGTILRLATAATFLAHGWEALHHHPGFVDLVIGSFRRLTLAAPDESTVRDWLTAIGTLDLAVGVLLVVRRWSGLALWALFWGFLTACSRTLALGPEFLFESTSRAMNGLAPLALWLAWRRR